MSFEKFNVLVVGGGHAGVEAAAAAARMGEKTLLLTQNIDTLGQMSCNPAIGGIGKSQLVKEVDALDGIMARAIDRAGIQFKVLNSSKGVAVQATRAQADRSLYRQAVQDILKDTDNLYIFQDSVNSLIIKNKQCIGCETARGYKIFADSVVLAVGTFLGGKIHIGKQNFSGGRAGDPASNVLSQQLRQYKWPIGRLKTGTPPRIDIRSIDLNSLEPQPGDDPAPVFSYLGDVSQHPKQVTCFISHTSPNCHDIIRKNLKYSAIFSGNIEGKGPRYCPSIEDKIHRFDRDSHQVFLEPEGLHSFEVYPNGVSTSLPFDVQVQFIKAMTGMENAWITRPGYAIEYDYFDPQALNLDLSTRDVKGLFLCGQINGTTGYEEAAAQGIVAGINAVQYIRNNDPFIIARDQGYIGVMIDDLITKGTQEPYRMFTSRAEYRLMLREDNADIRLTRIGRDLGVVSDERWQQFLKKEQLIDEYTKKALFSKVNVNNYPDLLKNISKNKTVQLIELFKHANIGSDQINKIVHFEDKKTLEYIITKEKYAGYIERQKVEIAKCKNNQAMRCPVPFDYANIKGLSTEIIEKLNLVQPINIDQAGRISGMTPAALSLLMVYFKNKCMV